MQALNYLPLLLVSFSKLCLYFLCYMTGGDILIAEHLNFSPGFTIADQFLQPFIPGRFLFGTHHPVYDSFLI
jgi:hypothetical protein